MKNLIANQTFQYIWSHPNSRGKQIQAIFNFLSWQIYKRVTKNTITLNLIPNIKLYCQPDSRSASSVLYCGLYDYDDMNFLVRYLRPEDCFLDIGANIGVYSLLAASKIKTGSIYAFEALPKNYQRLQENIALNQISNIQIYQVAISDQVGEICLNLAEGDSMPFITEETNQKTIKVSTNTLDNLLDQEVINNLTLAKMDIEGAELLAFKGATSILAQNHPYVWILEINDSVQHFGHQKQDVVNFLKQYGYSIYQYSAETNQLNQISLEKQTGNNVLAIHQDAIHSVKKRLQESSVSE